MHLNMRPLPCNAQSRGLTTLMKNIFENILGKSENPIARIVPFLKMFPALSKEILVIKSHSICNSSQSFYLDMQGFCCLVQRLLIAPEQVKVISPSLNYDHNPSVAH